MTDLPDAETAWREWFPVDEKSPRPGEREGFLAGFAAASGPWAEQLDAANARIAECPNCGAKP